MSLRCTWQRRPRQALASGATDWSWLTAQLATALGAAIAATGALIGANNRLEAASELRDDFAKASPNTCSARVVAHPE